MYVVARMTTVVVVVDDIVVALRLLLSLLRCGSFFFVIIAVRFFSPPHRKKTRLMSNTDPRGKYVLVDRGDRSNRASPNPRPPGQPIRGMFPG